MSTLLKAECANTSTYFINIKKILNNNVNITPQLVHHEKICPNWNKGDV